MICSANFGSRDHWVRHTSALTSMAVNFAGPGAVNVIPESVQLGGTLRALTKDQLQHLRQRVAEVIQGTAAVHGCKAELQWSDQAYGPTVNSKEVVSIVQRAGEALVGHERVLLLEEPTMAGEDFSFLAGEGQTPCTHTYTQYGESSWTFPVIVLAASC